MSERAFRHWRGREEEGFDGLLDRRLGRPSSNRAPVDQFERMHALYQARDLGFTVKHLHEKQVERYGDKLRYTAIRQYLRKTGAVQPSPQRRATTASAAAVDAGMLLQKDAFRHICLKGQPALDLVLTLDYASSELLSALLVPEENTARALPTAAATTSLQPKRVAGSRRPS